MGGGFAAGGNGVGLWEKVAEGEGLILPAQGGDFPLPQLGGRGETEKEREAGGGKGTGKENKALVAGDIRL